MYGDHAAYMTMNRAAYGAVPAAMMSPGGGALYEDPSNPLSTVGRAIRPVMYTPPARVRVTYSGMQPEPTGFFSSATGFMGIRDPSRSQMASDFIYGAASDFGERVGGGIGVAGVAAGGLALGAAMSPAVSAMARGVVGAAAGGGMAGSILGGAAGFLGGAFVAPALGMAVAQGVTSAVTERREIQGFLETQSFRFSGAGSQMADPRTRGMSRGARQDVTEFIRGMDVSDRFMDMGDLNTVLREGTSRGLFAGSGGDIESFKTKFKEITDSVKVITRTLGQTLEEGVKTLQELKSIGVDPTMARQFVSTADSMGRVAGRTGSEMLSIGMQGAEMFRGTGINMSVGAQANMMNLASVRAARDAKTLSEEAIMQAGGEAALAQRMTVSGLAFSQSAMGRGMTAAFVQGGQFNASSFMDNALSGGGDIRSLGLQAARNIASPADLIRFQANQEKIVSEMGQQFGGQGLQIGQMNAAMAQASMLASSTGVDMKSAFGASLKQMGLSDQEVQARMAMISGAGSNFNAMQAGVNQTRNAARIEEASRNFVFNRAGAAVKDIVGQGLDYVARPVNNFIDATAEAFVSFKEEQLYGIQRANVKGIDLSTPTFLKTTDDLGKISLDKGGILSTTVGEKLASVIKSGEFASLGITADSTEISKMGSTSARARELKRSGIEIDQGMFVSDNDLRRISDATANSLITTGEASQMKKDGAFKNLKTPNIGAMIAAGRFDKVETTDDLVAAVYGAGKTRGDISRSEYAFLVDTFQGTSLQGMLDKSREGANAVQSAKEATGILKMQQAREVYDKSTDALRGFFGGASDSVLTKLAAAREAQASGVAGADAMLNDVVLEYAKTSGVSIDEAKSILNKRGAGVDQRLKDLNMSRQVMRSAQAQLGSDELSSAIMGAVASNRDLDSDKDARDKITAVALKISRPGGLENLTGDEIASLSKAGGLGKGVADRLTNLNKIGSKDINKMERSDIRDSLTGVLGDKRVNQIIQTLDAGGTVEMSEIMAEARTNISRGIAGDDRAIASGSGSAEKGTESATQLAQKMTSINLQVLSVLEAMERRLR